MFIGFLSTPSPLRKRGIGESGAGLSRKRTLLTASASLGSAAPAATDSAIREVLSRLEKSAGKDFHKRVAVLGSTGSIGTQTLDIARAAPKSFSISALTANTDVTQLASQCAEFRPSFAAIADVSRYSELKKAVADVSPETTVLAGAAGVTEAAAICDAETVVTGIVGCAGLLPTVAAIRAGKDIALANKETLIAGGPVIVPLVKEFGVGMMAADSEHSAIFQCLQGVPSGSLKRIVLTASGGAFRDWKAEDLKNVRVEDALKHPNWTMGAKVTIDSASLYNKAAEVIEAHYLFGVDYDNIDAVIHRQSIIHSLVEFEDSSVIAQLGWPDMHLPILYSITWPHRINVGLKPFDITAAGNLTFEKIDFVKYPNMALAYSAGRKAGTMTCVLNAANEAAVEMFREEKIHFLDIPRLNEAMMDLHKADFIQQPTLDDIVHFDEQTRTEAREFVNAGKLAGMAVA